MRITIIALVVVFCCVVPWQTVFSMAAGSVDAPTMNEAAPAETAAHANPVATVLVSLLIIMLAAKLGGELLERIQQPAVLGELLFGIFIGNLFLVGIHNFEYLKQDIVIEVLAEIGVILLLFEVGLESNIAEMRRVGLSSLLVASLGVIAPFFLGFVVSSVFLPDESVYVHIFVGAVLCATSVGITARVLQDLGRIHRPESKIILGAAVIDDILGLMVLAVVVGIIRAVNLGGEVDVAGIGFTILKAVGFLVAAVVIGIWFSPRLFKVASLLRTRGVLLITALFFCFGLAYLAEEVGLATIVGAFAAGLILEPVHYQDLIERGEKKLEELLRPLATFLVPIFFVRMGILVDLSSFGQLNILGFAAALTIAAIIGKQICSLGVREKGLDRISVGVGMIPRGEVGLIVAAIGARMMLGGEPVITGASFSAVVIMVMATTLITPPALKFTLAWGEQRRQRQLPEMERPPASEDSSLMS